MGPEIRLIKDSIFEEIQDVLEGIRSRNKPITRLFDNKITADNFCQLFSILGHSCSVEELQAVDLSMPGFYRYNYLKYELRVMTNIIQ